MKAVALNHYGRIESNPLKAMDVPKPRPSKGQLLVKVNACGVCRTDLHIIEKELKPSKLPVIPGHQIVGVVAGTGRGAKKFKIGDRVGITWINSTCGGCEFCASGMENLCEKMKLTGYDVDGGYAEYALVSEDFAFRIPRGFDDIHAAPLFCAGIIGYRALKLSSLKGGQTLALFGFGASGHIIAQMAKHFGNRLIVFTRGSEHQKLAKRYGAAWAGEATDEAPEKADAAIITAPAGELVIDALRSVKKGGRVIIQDIYMSPIPKMDYNKCLYNEKSVASVTNYTRKDAEEFLKLAAIIPIRTKVQKFELGEANRALNLLKKGEINGAGVLNIR